MENIRARSDEPLLPLGAGGLVRIRKGVFGLSDAPRQWHLRLHRALVELGFTRSAMDFAMWMLWSSSGKVEGVVLSHVDDLLVGGNLRCRQLIEKLGDQLGFETWNQDPSPTAERRLNS